MSDPTIVAALIMGGSAIIVAVLGLIGGAMRYLVTRMLDTYKQQADNTDAARVKDLDAKDDEIERLQDGVTARLDRIDARLDRMEQSR